MQWHKIDTGTIVSGVDVNGVPYLKKFLIDYKSEFNVEVVNASCQKCIKNYHNEFKKKYGNMENNSNYILHKKREGLPLDFGSSIRVNNRNITDEYAERLIKRFKKADENFKLDYLFSKFPKEETKVVENKEIQPTTEEKPKRKRRTKKSK